MAQTKSEQIKQIFVVGLLVIALAVAYFRFFHKKKARGPGPAPTAISATDLTIPEITVKQPKPIVSSKAGDDQAREAPLRDIFAPAQWPVKHAQEESADMELERAAAMFSEPAAPKPLPKLTLQGTLVGGKKSIAIIDNRFVRIGDRIDEFTIVKITRNEVLLKSNEQLMVLKVVTSGDTQ